MIAYAAPMRSETQHQMIQEGLRGYQLPCGITADMLSFDLDVATTGEESQLSGSVVHQ
jgi:hypothetical protein